jgi:putative endonuclease
MAPIKSHPTEALAAQHLTQKGLALLEQNYHSRFGEIDLIMRDQHTLVFIEVRQRSSNRFGDALESVDQRKQQKIILTAQHYLSMHPDESPCRFDVVALDKDHQIQWVKDAFNAG